MRRIAASSDRERGGIAVIVALLMVVLLGFAAISIDVARLYSERAQLQNGADAVALMLAEKCAKKDASDCTEVLPRSSPLATTLANGNALDGLSNIRSIAIETAAKKASVSVGAQEKGRSPNLVTSLFAQALGIPNTEVSASSSAIWGTPSKGLMILPLAIAECKFNLDPGSQIAVEQVLDFQFGQKGGCGRVPGGFGWIAGTGPCSVEIRIGSEGSSTTWLSSDPGASAPSRCNGDDLAKMQNQTVLFPLWDKATGSGENAGYFVKGFAAFHVTGYNFANFSWTAGAKIDNKTIRGYFVKFVSLSQALELSDVPNYGASVVRLTIGAP